METIQEYFRQKKVTNVRQIIEQRIFLFFIYLQISY